MKRIIWMILLLILGIVLQATVFNYLMVVGVKPDILLIIVLLYALLYGKNAAVLGFCYGLVEDLLIGRFIGFNAILKAVMGWLVGVWEPKFFKDHLLVPIVVLLAGTLLHGLLSYGLGLLVGLYTFSEYQIYFRIMLIQAVYNACLAPFLYGRYYQLSMERFLRKLRR